MDVLGRMHANEFQAQFTAGLNDAHGDFSSVGYEDFMFCFLHRCTSCMILGFGAARCPSPGDWPGMDFLLLRSQLADAESSCGSDSIA